MAKWPNKKIKAQTHTFELAKTIGDLKNRGIVGVFVDGTGRNVSTD